MTWSVAEIRKRIYHRFDNYLIKSKTLFVTLMHSYDSNIVEELARESCIKFRDIGVVKKKNEIAYVRFTSLFSCIFV